MLPPDLNVSESFHFGVLETPVKAALNGLAIKSPIQLPEVKPATKVKVVVSVLVELEAMFEPEALRESIVDNAAVNAEANFSVSEATTKLP
ncbi:hypothetical protein ABB22_17350 [Stenotrophomonas nitritireducens]|uniref:Uncharacterized protein n=1 Tax=Stenotrophomonas nitritireducens TaxID=83617 RepID=A0ABR5NFJ4_9GAMM|nr:hypothetical protein ABB22_17350 [Stenotrophomonas nitritireducens]